MLKFLSVFILLITSVLNSKAQQGNDVVPVPLTNEIGINVGPVTGMGFSYRHWFKDEGLQVVLLPVKNKNILLINAALNYSHTFKQTERFRFYGYLGNSLFRYEGSGTDLNNAIPNIFLNMWQYKFRFDDDQEDFLHYNVGFGPGISTGRVVVFSAMLGYGFYDVLGDWQAFPSFEFSLMYRFK
jgi:hypothetical protein